MFAGAAREAVFSRPEVIRRVRAEFVPVALKAGLVNNPPDGDEGELYREIGRSKPAPQGICVVNTAGKVLDWVLMFDDDKSVSAFLDRALERFAKYPDAKRPVPAERYMKFPSAKLDDAEDSGKALPVADRHPAGKPCPAVPLLRQGTVVARLFGRALDKEGKLVTDAVRQENYVEDRFAVSVPMQAKLAQALADAGTERFRLPEELARLLVSHAFLGQLDVSPLGSPAGGSGKVEKCELWGQKVAGDGSGPTQIRVEGRSAVAGGQDATKLGLKSDGRLWDHEVKLTWEGVIELRGDRISRLVLLASGSEKLTWGNNLAKLKGEVDVAHLPAGHPIDFASGVRYGILGEPVAAEQAAPDGPAGEVPEEARRQLMEALGGPFLVFHGKVQKDLKLSTEQKEKLERALQERLQDAMQFFQKLEGLKPQEREKELGAYRGKAREKLAAVLKDALKEDQGKRLRQLELQQEGPFVLGGEVGKELKITDDQRKQFMAVVQEMQKKMEPLIKEANAGGKPEEIRPKLMKIRREHEGKIEAVLNNAQKKQWQEMLGKPLDLGD